MPAPDLGTGPKIGAASWQFGVSAKSPNKAGANAFIQFALQDKYLTAFSDGIGLIPSTPEAAAASKNYKAGGPMEVFYAPFGQAGAGASGDPGLPGCGESV